MDIYSRIERDQSWLDQKLSQLFGSLLRRLLDDQTKELKLVCSTHDRCVCRLVLGPLALVGQHSSRTASLIEDSNNSFTIRGTLGDGRMFHLTVEEKQDNLGGDLSAIKHGKATYQKICTYGVVKRKHKRKVN
ncbi:hypothetical protein pdul_cds_492 [Pandoravirus dulcis]|uniref:Uncharacterized protein n=1 Tax=Pandoravirus dulcis TaxID=1349409 RepID=S4VXF7_9VIRU|nr:hypothetical protein pdul_cds_492 [Pandoravirus dulcis]AGO82574.1 hypothetical protein pdul_cds_492 [Pandoravirus dulcis]